LLPPLEGAPPEGDALPPDPESRSSPPASDDSQPAAPIAGNAINANIANARPW
jgi:hypothetical protein